MRTDFSRDIRKPETLSSSVSEGKGRVNYGLGTDNGVFTVLKL